MLRLWKGERGSSHRLPTARHRCIASHANPHRWYKSNGWCRAQPIGSKRIKLFYDNSDGTGERMCVLELDTADDQRRAFDLLRSIGVDIVVATLAAGTPASTITSVTTFTSGSVPLPPSAPLSVGTLRARPAG